MPSASLRCDRRIGPSWNSGTMTPHKSKNFDEGDQRVAYQTHEGVAALSMSSVCIAYICVVLDVCIHEDVKMKQTWMRVKFLCDSLQQSAGTKVNELGVLGSSGTTG